MAVTLLGCCPKPEGCLESPGTLRYRIDGERFSSRSCSVDLFPEDVIAFKKVGNYHPPEAERQCNGCPLHEVTPEGEFGDWTEIVPRDEPSERGLIVGAFTGVVDGCRAEAELGISPIENGGTGSDFQMYRHITWDRGCAQHVGNCIDEFLMTELPAEE